MKDLPVTAVTGIDPGLLSYDELGTIIQMQRRLIKKMLFRMKLMVIGMAVSACACGVAAYIVRGEA
jgi:hypothetical protein